MLVGELTPRRPHCLLWGQRDRAPPPPQRVSFSSRIKVHVPTGFAAFPSEILHCPEQWVKNKYPKLISYSYMARGGHFAAFEEPELLAQDIRKFMGLLEQQ